MLSTKAISDYYLTRVYPQLENLEDERIAIVKKLKITRGLLFWSVAVGSVLVGNFSPSPANGASVVIFGIIVLIPSYFIFSYKSKKPFYKVFKSRVVEPMLKTMGTSVIYEPDNCIEEAVIREANLFKRMTGYRGDDYIKGRFGDMPLEFSQVDITERVANNSDSGSSSISLLTGFLFVMDIETRVNEGFALTTKSTLDIGQVFGGGIMGGVAKGVGGIASALGKNVDPQVVLSGDETFDKRFELRGSKANVDSFLTPEIQKFLLEIVANGKIVIGLRNKKLYFGVASSANFEGKISQSLKEYDEPLELMGHIQNAVTLAQYFDATKNEITMEW